MSLVEFFRKQETGSMKSRKGGAYSTMSVSSRSEERVYALNASSVVQGWRNWMMKQVAGEEADR